MKYNKRYVQSAATTVCTFLALAFGIVSLQSDLALDSSSFTAAVPSRATSMFYPVRGIHSSPSTMDERIAYRLRGRLQKKIWNAPQLSHLVDAVKQRHALLRSAVDVELLQPEGENYETWSVSLHRYPLWLKGSFSPSKAEFTLDEERIRYDLENGAIDGLSYPTDALLTEVVEDGDVIRAVTSDIAKPGLVIDAENTATRIADALRNGHTDLTVALAWQSGVISNLTDTNLGELQLLAAGRSNFKGSTPGRVANVRKALHEHVHNVLVPPGATFSFNETLGGPVTQSRGWSMAKIIVDGSKLETAPGGGICQASTTVYRAIVNAGFPVVDRRSHSLYVSYYKEYGVGIDATIYPGSQDLSFVNDSPSYLLVQSYTDGDDAYVNIYGTNDGREVVLEGPYFSNNAPDGLLVNQRPIRGNEVAWVQQVIHADGRTDRNVILSRYMHLPTSVKNEYVVAADL